MLSLSPWRCPRLLCDACTWTGLFVLVLHRLLSCCLVLYESIDIHGECLRLTWQEMAVSFSSALKWQLLCWVILSGEGVVCADLALRC